MNEKGAGVFAAPSLRSVPRFAWRTLIALALLASSALAHAILLSAFPTANQTVSGARIPAKLKFNSRIDAKRSALTLVGPDGKPTPLSLDKQDSPDTLGAAIQGIHSGAYVLRWQVLASDGHITRGQIPFQVE